MYPNLTAIFFLNEYKKNSVRYSEISSIMNSVKSHILDENILEDDELCELEGLATKGVDPNQIRTSAISVWGMKQNPWCV